MSIYISKCNQFNCEGKLGEKKSRFGMYWICDNCGHIIDQKCSCGGQRILTTYNEAVVAKCVQCGKYKY